MRDKKPSQWKDTISAGIDKVVGKNWAEIQTDSLG